LGVIKAFRAVGLTGICWPETAFRGALAKLLGQVTRPSMEPSAHSSSVSADTVQTIPIPLSSMWS